MVIAIGKSDDVNLVSKEKVSEDDDSEEDIPNDVSSEGNVSIVDVSKMIFRLMMIQQGMLKDMTYSKSLMWLNFQL